MSIKFLFLFSPNNSGSTIIGQYLETQTNGYLPPFGNNEGQMAPGVRKIMRKDQWKADHDMPWPEIRDAWSDLARQAGKDLFIECSPPNILRVTSILKSFGEEARCLFSIASPYSFIASILFNYNTPPLRPPMLARAAESWVLRAQALKEGSEAHPEFPRMRYEDFCEDPTIVNRALGLEVKARETIAGKGNDPLSEIIDLSPRHHAFLSFSEWEQVNAVLSKHESLMEFFGYSLIPGQLLIEKCAETPAMFHSGLIRRVQWEQKQSRAKQK
jgi:hypothetical protein